MGNIEYILSEISRKEQEVKELKIAYNETLLLEYNNLYKGRCFCVDSNKFVIIRNVDKVVFDNGNLYYMEVSCIKTNINELSEYITHENGTTTIYAKQMDLEFTINEYKSLVLKYQNKFFGDCLRNKIKDSNY